MVFQFITKACFEAYFDLIPSIYFPRKKLMKSISQPSREGERKGFFCNKEIIDSPSFIPTTHLSLSLIGHQQQLQNLLANTPLACKSSTDESRFGVQRVKLGWAGGHHPLCVRYKHTRTACVYRHSTYLNIHSTQYYTPIHDTHYKTKLKRQVD